MNRPPFSINYDTLQVFMPTKAYNGQKPTKLVRVKIPAATKATVPHKPVTVPVAYRATSAATTNNLMILSADPIFFFISIDLIEQLLTHQK